MENREGRTMKTRTMNIRARTTILDLRRYQLRQLFLTFFIAITLVSCVTINIYFPAAAAEKAAEKIVDEVLKNQPGSSNEQNIDNKQSTDNKQSSLKQPEITSTQTILLIISDFLFPVAQAGQADISIDSPAIRTIRNNMESRQSKLLPFYQSGAIGFTNNGLIASVNNQGLSVKQKSTIKKLIKAENRDRMALYSEIAKANGHPEWQKDIQSTFSKTWIRKISSGWMYQAPSGQWQKK